MMKSNEKTGYTLQLTKDSTKEEIERYFVKVLELSQSDEEYPVDLEMIWPLAYKRKEESVRALTSEFMELVDYQVLRKNAENPKGGRPVDVYKLTVPCMEYFIARKVRGVFEVYRQVFHKVANSKTVSIGNNNYFTIYEYCNMFGKTKQSFWGLYAHYMAEFAMIAGMWYISKSLCKMMELKTNFEAKKAKIKSASEALQLNLEFND